MERPYDIDVNGLIHWSHVDDCRLREERDGDANRDGVVEGIAEYGEVPCPACIDDAARMALMEAAVDKKRILG